jgi:hypothetical protein
MAARTAAFAAFRAIVVRQRPVAWSIRSSAIAAILFSG